MNVGPGFRHESLKKTAGCFRRGLRPAFITPVRKFKAIRGALFMRSYPDGKFGNRCLIRLFTLTASFCARQRPGNLEAALLSFRFHSLPDAKAARDRKKLMKSVFPSFAGFVTGKCVKIYK